MTKQTWKAYYRQLRIIRRESWKATMDTVIYGTGFIRISHDGFVNHVLAQSVLSEELLHG